MLGDNERCLFLTVQHYRVHEVAGGGERPGMEVLGFLTSKYRRERSGAKAMCTEWPVQLNLLLSV